MNQREYQSGDRVEWDNNDGSIGRGTIRDMIPAGGFPWMKTDHYLLQLDSDGITYGVDRVKHKMRPERPSKPRRWWAWWRR